MTEKSGCGNAARTEQLSDDYIAAINDAVRDPPDRDCLRAPLPGQCWHGQASGGYNPVAERLFQRTDVDGFFLEYDTDHGYVSRRWMAAARTLHRPVGT